MKPIILRTQTRTDECIGTVRLTPEAEKVVRRLRFKTGLPIMLLSILIAGVYLVVRFPPA